MVQSSQIFAYLREYTILITAPINKKFICNLIEVILTWREKVIGLINFVFSIEDLFNSCHKRSPIL